MTVAAPSKKAGRPQGAPDTREHCLLAAERRFAAQGFAGTGLREVAAEAGISIATLLYHFGSKEKLYGRVLGRIADSIVPYLPGPEHPDGSLEVTVAMVERFLDWSLDHEHYACLLLRELMENPERVQKARRWHLQPVIDAYAAAIRRGQAQGTLGETDAEMFVFYVTGAVTHFRAAAVTIQRMLGMAEHDAVVARFRETLRASTAAMLAPRPRRRRPSGPRGRPR